ncbi:MAG: RNA polymerase sigma-70 factor [Tannerellaceae bacterium]|nr:RNA polymerase sigma-70 factor [Tannerellaceae bacterium]
MNAEHTHIANLQSGDIQSFEYLYNKWSGKIYNFVMQISNQDIYLAEEIIQTVFIKVWERHKELDPEKSFSSYLFTITKNQISKIYRQRMYELLYQQHIVYDGDNSSENTTENEVKYKLLNEYIDLLIDQLPAARREIFIMSRKKFMTNKEITQRLNISEHTVESQLTKANTFIRTKLKDHYELSIALLFAMLMR